MTGPTIRDIQTQARELRLYAESRAVATARWFTVATLWTWRLPDDVIETAEVVTSELMTNAVLHTERMTDLSAVVWLRVRVYAEDIIVEVWDGDSTPPSAQELGPDAENGRGLNLVTQLGGKWGYHCPPAGGKIVWTRIVNAQGKDR